MGLFSGLKKIVKNVFKGVKKVFKKVGSFVGKVLGSKWGKALLTAAAVVTGGLAIAAGVGGFTGASATTFLGKFVAGSKAFIGALMNPIGAGKGAIAGAQGGGGLAGAAQGAAQGQGIFNIPGVTGAEGGAAAAGEIAQAAQDPSQMVQAGEGATMGAPGTVQPNATTAGVNIPGQSAAPGGVPGAMGPPKPVPQMGPPSPAVTPPGAAAPPPAEPGLLAKAGKSAMGFAKSTGGGLILSNMAQGYAQGKMQEDMLKRGDYYDRQWADPRQMMLLEAAANRRPAVPSGYLERARSNYGGSSSTDASRGVPFGASRQGGYATGVSQ